MAEEVAQLFSRHNAVRIVDGTVGLGGHAEMLLERDGGVSVLGLDRDGEVLKLARRRLERFAGRVVLEHESYRDLGGVLRRTGWEAADGILLDLGICSYHVERAERGFSFQHDAVLDMRFSADRGEPAAALIKRISEQELSDVIYRYGEERNARKIAKRIKQAEPETTKELAELVAGVARKGSESIHPATRTFQALRIEVNEELQHLKAFLRRFPRFLSSRGCLIIISYHSLEDRMVKHQFQALEKDGIGRMDGRKVRTPSPGELKRNRRSRSARMRVFSLGARP